jgi:hypothetical protein
MAILILGIALRCYRLPEQFLFEVDQGRDAMIVSEMIASGRPVQLGPASGTFTHYRGPAYYYMLLPAYLLGGGHPISGVALNIVLDLATMLLLFLLTRSLFGSYWAGLAAAALWSCCDIVLYYDRIAWNPTLLPFFVLLILYALKKIVNGHQRFLLLLIPLWSIAWQLHDQALFLLPFFAIVWLWFRPRIPLTTYIGALALGILSLAPFLVYELQHSFVNIRGMVQFGGSNIAEGGQQGRWATAQQRLQMTFDVLNVRMIPANTVWVYRTMQGLLFLGVGFLIFLAWRGPKRREAQLILLALLLPFCYVAWPYRFDPYYLMILFVLPLLLIGLGIEALRRVNWMLAIPPLLVIVFTVTTTSATTFQKIAAIPDAGFSGDYHTIRRVADNIIAATGAQPFTWNLVAQSNHGTCSEMPYLYVFNWLGHPPTRLAEQGSYSIYEEAQSAKAVGQEGAVIDDAKIVYRPPLKLGKDVLTNGDFSRVQNNQAVGWDMPGGGAQFASENGLPVLHLTSTEVSDRISAYQDVRIEPRKQYLVRFDYRVQLQGFAHVYFQVSDQANSVINTFPTGAGYVLPPAMSSCPYALPSDGWGAASYIVDVPANGAKGSIIVRNRGIGEAWFRDIQVREIIP